MNPNKVARKPRLQLTELLDERGWTKQKLVRECRKYAGCYISRQTVYDWIKGETTAIHWINIGILRDVFDVSFDELFTFEPLPYDTGGLIESEQ
jgi:hypothetical protein